MSQDSRSPQPRPPRRQQVIILKGLPGSGKSTWAREQLLASKGRIKRINKDDLRAMLDAGEWSATNERFVVQARDTLLMAALTAGYDVIIDDTNLDPFHERRIRQLTGSRADVSVRFFDIPIEECIRRDALRPFPVGETVIREMARQWLG